MRDLLLHFKVLLKVMNSVSSHILVLIVGIAIGLGLQNAKINTALEGCSELLRQRHLSEEPNYRSGKEGNQHHHLPGAHHQFSTRKSRKYFVDFGANRGSAIKHFVSPKVPGEVPNAMFNYDIKGLGSDGEWHVVAVEANPAYTSRLEQMKSQYVVDGKVQSFELFSGTAIFTR